MEWANYAFCAGQEWPAFLFPGAAMMGMQYCILPDGSIFKLTCPEDFCLAREIAREEIGDLAKYVATYLLTWQSGDSAGAVREAVSV